MDIVELIVDFIETLIHFLFLITILPPKKKNIKWAVKFTVCVLIYTALTYTVTIDNKILLTQDIITVGKLFGVSLLLCEGLLFEKLSFSIISSIITTIASMTTAIMIPRIMNLSVAETLANDGSKVRIAALVFAKMTQLIISLVIIILLKNKKSSMEDKMWLPMAMMLFISEKIINLMMTSNFTENKSYKEGLLLAVMIISILENVVVLWIFYRILNHEKDEIMINSFIQNIDREVDAVKEKEKTLTELRMLKHEIRDLYIPLREMMNDGRYDEAIQKISETINDAEDNFDTMFIFDTGSASVNAVINYYLRSMFRNGIKVKQNITKMSLAKEDEEALCLVLINMLKNAYENLLHSGEKEAYLFFGKDKGYIKVIVANKIRNSILENNAGLMTSKEDKNNHGYGTRIIKRMAEKRKGEAHFYEENGFFTVEVWLEKA